MQTDRELLEDAARAAGMGDLYQWDEDSECIKYPYRSELTDGHLWNPRKDCGDALRLAVKLRINVYHSDPSRSVTAARAGHRGCRVEFSGNESTDTCLAITRAAAEIGNAMS